MERHHNMRLCFYHADGNSLVNRKESGPVRPRDHRLIHALFMRADGANLKHRPVLKLSCHASDYWNFFY